nr:MAG: hypothetical protein [Microviridae sp.]
MTPNKIAFTEQPSKMEPIPNTPFMVVGNETDGYMVAISNRGLTPLYKTPEEAKAHLSTNFWQVILNLLIIAPDLIKEILGALNINNTVE